MGYDEEARSEEMSAEEMSAEETPAEETPAEETPAEETSAEEMAAEDVPAEDGLADDIAAEEPATEELSGDDAPSFFSGDDEPEEELRTGDDETVERPEVLVRAGGDAIRSGNITVGGKHFADWFNEDLRPAHPGNHPTARPHGQPIAYLGADVNKASFIETFNHCEHLYGPQLGFHQFVAMFCVFYNETGGRLRCVSESDFLPTVERRLRAAMRYNKAPNRLAGAQLAERGLLTDDADIAAWNGTSYPGPSESDPDPDRRALFAAAQECDFYKYRGRGLNQLTWRKYITMIVDPLLAAAGYGKTCDQLTERELSAAVETDPRIGYGMSRSYFTRREFLGTHFATVDAPTPDWARVGKAVSGDPNPHGYAEIYAWRCETLRAAMDEAGWQAD